MDVRKTIAAIGKWWWAGQPVMPEEATVSADVAEHPIEAMRRKDTESSRPANLDAEGNRLTGRHRVRAGASGRVWVDGKRVTGSIGVVATTLPPASDSGVLFEAEIADRVSSANRWQIAFHMHGAKDGGPLPWYQPKLLTARERERLEQFRVEGEPLTKPLADAVRKADAAKAGPFTHVTFRDGKFYAHKSDSDLADRYQSLPPKDAPDSGPAVQAGEHADALPAGYRLEEFEIIRVLGRGGFAITYLAVDRQLDQQVAIKEYFPESVALRRGAVAVGPTSSGRETFEWGFDRFRDEARALGRFRHPNVVGSRRYFPANGTAYLVLDYVEGESLADILASRGPLSLGKWRPWLDHLLDGLEHVHAGGYLHRDITPRNIVIRASDEQPVLIDFGAARIATGGKSLTAVLTEAYAPMEQHSKRAPQGAFTDIYSLGVVTYRALTGDLPSPAPDRAIEDDYVPLAHRMDEATHWMEAADHALAPAPKDRPQTASEWRNDLIEAAATSWMRGEFEGPSFDDAGLKPLHRAAASESIPAVVGRLLDRGEGLQDQTSKHSLTPLHYAAWQNRNPDILALLLDRGADIQAPGSIGSTPLHWAAWGNRNPPVLALLLDRGADVHAQMDGGRTPLHQAAWGNQNPAVLACLLDQGADIHAQRTGGYTPLHDAAWANANPAVLALLLVRGADIHTSTKTGDTAVDIAARHNRNSAVLQLLRQTTASTDDVANERFAYVVRDAAEASPPDRLSAKEETPEAIIERYKDLTGKVRNSWKRSRVLTRELHAAVKRDDVDAVAYLLELGANANARDGNLSIPLDITARDILFGPAPLHLAVSKGRKDMVAVLLNHGADVNIRDKRGSTPLHVASRSDNNSIVKYLLDHNASINAKDKMRSTPLHKAAANDAKATLEYLLDHGGDINARDSRLYTPIHKAAENNALDVLQILIDRGANVDARTEFGRTIVHLARNVWVSTRDRTIRLRTLLAEKDVDVDRLRSTWRLAAAAIRSFCDLRFWISIALGYPFFWNLIENPYWTAALVAFVAVIVRSRISALGRIAGVGAMCLVGSIIAMVTNKIADDFIVPTFVLGFILCVICILIIREELEL